MKRFRTQYQGFTLIELMIVIAVLAILLVFAVPAYQNYTVRAQNGECISLAASAKLAIAETAMERGILVTDVNAADTGWSFPDGGTKFCTAMTIGDNGAIHATSTAGGGDGGVIVFTPVQARLEDPIDWNCGSADYSGPQLPSQCRGDADA